MFSLSINFPFSNGYEYIPFARVACLFAPTEVLWEQMEHAQCKYFPASPSVLDVFHLTRGIYKFKQLREAFIHRNLQALLTKVSLRPFAT